MVDVFLELTSLETSLLEYGQYNLNRTTSELNMSSIHMGKALSNMVSTFDIMVPPVQEMAMEKRSSHNIALPQHPEAINL